MASFIKWIGTIIILSVGIILAYKFSSTANVDEIKVYKVVLPAYEFNLADANKAYLSLELLFYTKEGAKKAIDNNELLEVLGRVFAKLSSNDFSSNDGLLKIRAELFLTINKTLFSIINVKFYTNPKVY